VFNFFKKKPENELLFNILDETTWHLASDKVFEWNEKKIKHYSSRDRYAAENEIVDFIGVFIKVCENDYEADRKQKEIGKTNIIAHILTYLICGMDWDEVMEESVHWVNNYNPNDNKQKFDVSDISTWEFASEQYIIWNNKIVYDKDKIAVTEKCAVNLFNSIYAFLERNGKKLTPVYKVEKAKMMLNKLTTPIESNNEKQPIKPKNGAFDPRNPETYQFATNNQLVIDGVSIFKTHQDINGKEIKENETEEGFVKLLSSLLEIRKKEIVWEEAVKLVKPDFTFEGKEPNQGTPGYVEKANEVYQSILKNPAARLTKKQEREYINNHIALKLEECSPMPQIIKSLGGHGFTHAQIEVLELLPDEDLVAIGKTLSGGLRGRRLEQALFNAHGNLNRDWHHLVKLYDQNVAQEKEIMYDFYIGFEGFTSTQDVYDFFNSRPYLKKHPELKEKVIKTFLECIEKEGDDE
jgi:hypothetical protein